MAIPSLNIGGGKWATKQDKLLAYKQNIGGRYFAINGDTSRNSTATFTNQNGLIDSVGNNVARVDFQDDVKGSLLLEPQSTNLVTQSESFGNSYWTKSGTTVVGGFASPSLDSPTGAFKLVPNNGLNSSRIRKDIALTSGITNTFSVYVKSAEFENASIWINNPNISEGIYLGYNNDVNTTTGIVNGSDLKYESMQNGWGVMSITFTPTATQDFQIVITAKSVSGENVNSISGNGTSGVYMFGAQLEQLPYATSYIPTSGSAVTRVKDVANSFGDVNTFNSEEGVLFVEMAALSDDLTVRYLSLSDGTAVNRIYIRFDNVSNRIIVNMTVAGGGGSTLLTTSYTITDFNKIAFKYKLNDFALWINGVEVTTSLSGGVFTPNILNSFQFDLGNGSHSLYSKVKQLQVYKEALTDAELITLTTI